MSDQYVPKLRQRFVEDMQIKGLQAKTQTMCLRAMRDFTRFLAHAPDSATPEELRAFQLDMKERGVGAPTFNNRLTVLSFFFASTCPHPEMKQHMRYQRAVKKIPVVLSAEEVSRIIEAAPGPGLRYRAAFSVAYGGGLRASEVTHLKVGDIDSDRMLIRIEHGKGRKDRQVMLSPNLLSLLRDYYREARPRGWMFPGRNRIDPISTRQFKHPGLARHHGRMRHDKSRKPDPSLRRRRATPCGHLVITYAASGLWQRDGRSTGQIGSGEPTHSNCLSSCNRPPRASITAAATQNPRSISKPARAFLLVGFVAAASRDDSSHKP